MNCIEKMQNVQKNADFTESVHKGRYTSTRKNPLAIKDLTVAQASALMDFGIGPYFPLLSSLHTSHMRCDAPPPPPPPPDAVLRLTFSPVSW